MAKKLVVDKDDCTSCGMCAEDLPEVFELDSDGLAQVKNQDAAMANEGKVADVIDACPGECIHWR